MVAFKWEPLTQQYRRSLEAAAKAEFAYDHCTNVPVVYPTTACMNMVYDPGMPHSYARVDSTTGPGPVDAAGGHANIVYDVDPQVMAIIPQPQSANIPGEPVLVCGQRDLAAYDDSGREGRIETVQPLSSFANMTFDSTHFCP